MSPIPEALSSVFSPVAKPPPRLRLTADDLRPATWSAEEPAKRRTMIWDLHHSLHCSIIGTCLSTAELRRLLIKLAVGGAAEADDHALHMLGVMLAGRPQTGAKLLQKTLDRRHDSAIKQFARIKDAAAIQAMWDDALRNGDIPGAYWAVLTHPATPDALVKKVFGDVHMLSHLVGAANRADIRRLRALEEDNAALTAKIERQQRQLRDGFVERDATIQQLRAALVNAVAAHEPSAAPDNMAAMADTIADLDKRLSRETARRESVEQRLAAVSQQLKTARDDLMRTAQDSADLADELAALEQRLGTELDGQSSGPGLDLAGLRVLYVGGRANQVPQLTALAARHGANLSHHDGGIEQSTSLLPGLVSRVDLVVAPVDCISHSAMDRVKQLSRQAAKSFVPLRTASLASLLAALSATTVRAAAE